MAPFFPLFKHSFSTFDEQTYRHSHTPPNPCKYAPPPAFNTLIDNLSTTPPKTLWKTSWKLGSLGVWKLGFHAPLLHEDTKGTQGPGHFTVRRVAPHYRAHPLRFCDFPGKPHAGLPEWRNRRCSVASLGRPYGISPIGPIRGRLPPAGLPEWITLRGHPQRRKDSQRTQRELAD